MNDTPFDPSIETEILIKVPTEWEAQLILNELTDHGIKASLEGTQTSAFQAEAPGEVSVVVRKNDLADAEEVLEDMDRDGEESDSSEAG